MILWRLPESPDVATVRHYEHRVYVSKSREELVRNLALLEEGGQNCRKKLSGIQKHLKTRRRTMNGVDAWVWVMIGLRMMTEGSRMTKRALIKKMLGVKHRLGGREDVLATWVSFRFGTTR